MQEKENPMPTVEKFRTFPFVLSSEGQAPPSGRDGGEKQDVIPFRI